MVSFVYHLKLVVDQFFKYFKQLEQRDLAVIPLVVDLNTGEFSIL